jgi:cytochrome b561
MIRDSEHHWGTVSRSLHWLMGVLLATQWGLGKLGHEMARSPAKLDVLTWHKSLGVLLLLLVALRLAWRLSNRSPVLPGPAPAWEGLAARITHVLLYALMLAIPLSGWVMASAKNVPFRVFWLLPWPDIVQPSESLGETAGAIHAALATLLLAVVSLHVAAALRHHLILRNDVLRRMLPGSRARD